MKSKRATLKFPRGTKLEGGSRAVIFVRPGKLGYWVINERGKLELMPTVVFETLFAQNCRKKKRERV